MSLEIHKMPSISTGHLTKEVADILTAQGDGNPWCPCATWEYGYFLFLDEPEAGLAPVPKTVSPATRWTTSRLISCLGTIRSSQSGRPITTWSRNPYLQEHRYEP